MKRPILTHEDLVILNRAVKRSLGPLAFQRYAVQCEVRHEHGLAPGRNGIAERYVLHRHGSRLVVLRLCIEHWLAWRRLDTRHYKTQTAARFASAAVN